MIPEALEKARQLDEFFKTGHGTVKGALHGLPISVKDQFHVKGSDTTMGYVGWIGTFEGDGASNKIRTFDSQIISDLEAQGAVVFCKYDETINHIIGQTLNPVNRLLSCGGSSGGEAALISMGGSSFGLGTDIGTYVFIPSGSSLTSIQPALSVYQLRSVASMASNQVIIGSPSEEWPIPCHFPQTPSSGYTTLTVSTQNPGQTLIPSSVGFLSKSLRSLSDAMGALLSTSPWLRDPAVVPIPWRKEARLSTRKKLRFGIFWWDGMVQPHPPIRRALQMVVAALERAGHEVIDWCPPSHTIPERLHPAIMNADGSCDIQKQLALSGEPLLHGLDEFHALRAPMSLLEYQHRALQLRDYRQEYADYWNGTRDADGNVVDAVLMPVAPHAAVIPGMWEHLAYTEVLNLLDYTALAIPVTHADENIDLPHAYVPVSAKDSRNWTAYYPGVYHGAPVGIQIVGRVCEEEKIIGVAEMVEECLETKGQSCL
ncbi:hypothetical protein EYC84_002538 [Monilinia fructicola]|uniref:Amidase domain-containing protein n=1 Tax=Monilinia fructicola TaxID=38448 RepID=A0A5M9JR06_MONFR|nr:hypothetical protein EYC84_002538 [Monilinia fructicola]